MLPPKVWPACPISGWGFLGVSEQLDAGFSMMPKPVPKASPLQLWHFLCPSGPSPGPRVPPKGKWAVEYKKGRTERE